MKKFLIGTFALALFALVASTASADCSIVSTLKVGSTGAEVSCLQTKVGATADGAFGPLTKASVMAYQSNHGLSADGVVGPLSRAVLNASLPVTPGTTVAGCQAGALFNALTGASCTAPVVTAGCPAGALFNSMTGASCTGAPVVTGALEGGAGDLTITTSSTGVENKVGESKTEKVLGFKGEADGSDIAVTSLKVVLSNTGYLDTGADTTSSEKVSDYLDTVSVYMGSTKVGSADLADFTRDSGSPDTYTKTISLSNAIVREGDKNSFFIEVTANDTIDSDDLADATIKTDIDSIRYQDATGMVLSTDLLGDLDKTFTFTDATDSDKIDLKASTNNPKDSTVAVDENNTTDDVLGLAFKLDVDSDSADVQINSLPITLSVTNFDLDASGTVGAEDAADLSGAGVSTWIDSIVESVSVKIAGNTYEATMDDYSGANQDLIAGAGAVIYTVDLDTGDLVINAGDIEEAKVYITFKEQDGNYNEAVTVTPSIVTATISAETSNDDLTVNGGQTGAKLTLSLSAATISGLTGTSTQNDAGTVGTFVFKFTVEADGGNVILDTGDVANIAKTVLGGNKAVAVSLVNLDGDATENTANVKYTVLDGETNTFSLTYTTGIGAAGSYYVRVTKIGGTVVNITAGPESLITTA